MAKNKKVPDKKGFLFYRVDLMDEIEILNNQRSDDIEQNEWSNLYMIDCDRGFENGRLGCLCLETREEFYV